jgi:hypothetical protein
MAKWKKSKKVWRVTVRGYDKDEVEGCDWIFDILDDELDADSATDFHAYFNWLYDDKHGDDWEVVDVVPVDIWSWKEMRSCHFLKGFYSKFHHGEKLNISFLDYNK